MNTCIFSCKQKKLIHVNAYLHNSEQITIPTTSEQRLKLSQDHRSVHNKYIEMYLWARMHCWHKAWSSQYIYVHNNANQHIAQLPQLHTTQCPITLQMSQQFYPIKINMVLCTGNVSRSQMERNHKASYEQQWDHTDFYFYREFSTVASCICNNCWLQSIDHCNNCRSL